MSDHQPADSDPDLDSAAGAANAGGDVSQALPPDRLELDFSRLEMARACLDAAFRQR